VASSSEAQKFCYIFVCLFVHRLFGCIVHVKLGHDTLIMFIEQSIFLPETGFFLCLNLIIFMARKIMQIC
jgi:hypothetical protein